MRPLEWGILNGQSRQVTRELPKGAVPVFPRAEHDADFLMPVGWVRYWFGTLSAGTPLTSIVSGKESK